jgi:butyrate kinase
MPATALPEALRTYRVEQAQAFGARGGTSHPVFHVVYEQLTPLAVTVAECVNREDADRIAALLNVNTTEV